MEFLIVLLLGAVIYLYTQVEDLKRQVRLLEDGLDRFLHSMKSRPAVDHAEDFAEPAQARPTRRSAVMIRQSDSDETTTAPVEPLPQPDPEEEPVSVAVTRADHAAEQSVPAHTRQAAAQEKPAGKGFSFDFEDIVGRKLPIWVGGITLAVAGVLMVRYSIEAGLMTPQVRVILSFLFGIGLLVAAEIAYRFEDRVADERVRQALAGAGLATLYAGFYLAGTQYGLIGQTVAFAGLALVTALAIGLSYRFGLPSAVLGLVGGFAAPALVGGDQANLPLLSLYLGLVTAGLTYTGNKQRRPWLGMAALIGGLGWGALLLMSDGLETADLIALGLYLVVLGAVLPAMLASDRFEQPLRLISAGLASIQLAALVTIGDFSLLTWGLYLLLGAALAWFGWNKPAMRPANAIAASVAIFMLLMWENPAVGDFTMVAGALTALFAGVPLAHIRRSDQRIADMAMTAAVPLGIASATFMAFGTFDHDMLRPWEALAFTLCAAISFAASRMLWTRDRDGMLAINLASGAILVVLAAACLLPTPAIPIAAAVVALALIYLLRERVGDNGPLAALLRSMATIITLLVPATVASISDLERLWNGVGTPDFLDALRWLSACAPWAALAWVERQKGARNIAEFAAGLLLFVVVAQIVPPKFAVWIAAGIIALLRWRMPDRGTAMLGLLVPMVAWTIVPLGKWISGAMLALTGEPLLTGELPSLSETVGFIVPLAVGLGITRLTIFGRRIPLWPGAVPIGIIAVHVLYRQIFAIDTIAEFHAFGLAERTVWEALLLATAWLFARGAGPVAANRWVAIALAGASLAHFTVFTGLLHNPLWSQQAVGSVPVANLVLVTYGVAVAALLSLRLWLPRLRNGFDAAIMAFTLIGAITLLRQMFAGSYLDTVPMGQTEDLLRSLIGIVLAVIFLLIGSRRGERSWRVGSLVLMTGTVFKVFLLDTAGLEGLVRIASFVALGASLIGIGWFYSRQLRAAPQDAVAETGS